ncbi:MAG: heat-inducible transcription repressor HrcA [Coriobacteriia bacterium]|nr:heat-inducible transcription repressor HrcA [Coriobacteriia bacterium]
MLNERRRRVLQALVEEYVQSATPVGSKTLVDRYELGCSPATVRNELAILEETGYVVQPHVSAGRLPTDTGYRSFVNDIIERGNPSLESNRIRSAGLRAASEVDELMRRTSVALTELTNCLAVVLAPSVSLARVKRLDLVSMAPNRALFVLITEAGQVVNHSIILAEEATQVRLREVEELLNRRLSGKQAEEIRIARFRLEEGRNGDGLVSRVVDEILVSLGEADRDRLYHVGVPALLAQPEFHDAERAGPLIEFLEDGISVLEMFSDALGKRELTVRIGHENRRAELGNVSIVAMNYGTGVADGVIGVIGPTRMNYPRAMAAVRAVADDLSDVLS